MCQNTANITFCTCEVKPEAVHNKNSRRGSKNEASPAAKSYRWSLHRTIGLSEHSMDGLLIEPDHAFTTELSAESILQEMNTRNCFDFDYAPNDGDNFGIFENGTGKFMAFIFENREWRIGSPNPFTHQLEKFNSGSVRFETEE